MIINFFQIIVVNGVMSDTVQGIFQDFIKRKPNHLTAQPFQ